MSFCMSELDKTETLRLLVGYIFFYGKMILKTYLR